MAKEEMHRDIDDSWGPSSRTSLLDRVDGRYTHLTWILKHGVVIHLLLVLSGRKTRHGDEADEYVKMGE